MRKVYVILVCMLLVGVLSTVSYGQCGGNQPYCVTSDGIVHSNTTQIGNPNMFGYIPNASFQVYGDLGLPTIVQHLARQIVQCKGDNATFIGCKAGYFEARDRTDVIAANKGVLYALSLSVVPIVGRNNVPFDDVDGLTITNSTGVSGAKATDAIYISRNSSVFPSSSEWSVLFSADANADTGIQLGGRIVNYGIDLKPITLISNAAIRFPNNSSLLYRDFGNVSDRTLIGSATDDSVTIGNGSPRIDLQTTTQAKVDLNVVGKVTIAGAASTVGAGIIAYGGTTATTATAGANGAVPAQVAGYIIINVGGTAQKVPYFNN